MIIQVRSTYTCECCKKEFESYWECKTHEAEHYKLSLKDFIEWHKLFYAQVQRNRLNNMPFDIPYFAELAADATQDLQLFEKEHNLTNIDKHPDDFQQDIPSFHSKEIPHD